MDERPATIVLRAESWRSYRDDSRPTGDLPTTGDYIITKDACYRIVGVAGDRQRGWELTCEVQAGYQPWAGVESDFRVFDWDWRVSSS